mgnify:FL=1
MTRTRRFVYVARLKTGDEVGLRRALEHLPATALADAGFAEFTTYVGSGFCVLQFGLSGDDFQVQFERFWNNADVRAFTERLAGYLVEGEQIARGFAIGDPRFHAGAEAGTGGAVTSAELPLAYEASHWPMEGA